MIWLYVFEISFLMVQEMVSYFLDLESNPT